MADLKWSYGVTTVPSRADSLLPRTLHSLCDAGFSRPRLFVDGCRDVKPYKAFELEATMRWPRIDRFGNWILAFHELYHRNTNADRYAIFQDDCVMNRNLRAYLDRCEYPANGYWNLYTHANNRKRQREPDGWNISRQKGMGALGLVFSQEAAQILLPRIRHVEEHKKSSGKRSIDGGVVNAMSEAGWKEWIHSPSLVQHTGAVSSIGNKTQIASVFEHENFDALDFLK